ncbi:MAG: sigma-54-dependent Fis family transcriptional regulator [Deltaproteobacteria bacterium]|nr:sigma-54-dependent Fis family transcriptional regulator [Deltaproteobacteria bacterium]
MPPKKILIIGETTSSREYLEELVQIIGFEALSIKKKTDFLAELQRFDPDLVLLGSCNSAAQAEAFAKVVESEKGGVPIVLIQGDTKKLKAADLPDIDNLAVLSANLKPNDLRHAIHKLIKDSENAEFRELDKVIVGQAQSMLNLKKHILDLSKSDVTVLITGESGTGKELVAESIHRFSARAKNPFIKVNSAALPSNLLESELFGYEKGAFTGAWQKKPGKFVLAHSGTLLLDEIGEIPLPMQAKLLQVLEDQQLSTLGSTSDTQIDVRVLAATNCNLAQMVSEGRFRSDLFFRLNVVHIHVPPLRERKEDINLLCDYFLDKYAERHDKPRTVLQETTMSLFHQYSWPGNVRELENIIQSITVLGNEESFWPKLQDNSGRLTSAPANDSRGPEGSAAAPVFSLDERPTLKEVCREAARRAETDAILDVLAYTRWNRRKAAKLLQISYKALLNKIKDYEIEQRYREYIGKDFA